MGALDWYGPHQSVFLHVWSFLLIYITFLAHVNIQLSILIQTPWRISKAIQNDISKLSLITP